MNLLSLSRWMGFVKVSAAKGNDDLVLCGEKAKILQRNLLGVEGSCEVSSGCGVPGRNEPLCDWHVQEAQETSQE